MVCGLPYKLMRNQYEDKLILKELFLFRDLSHIHQSNRQTLYFGAKRLQGLGSVYLSFWVISFNRRSAHNCIRTWPNINASNTEEIASRFCEGVGLDYFIPVSPSVGGWWKGKKARRGQWLNGNEKFISLEGLREGEKPPTQEVITTLVCLDYF